MTTVHSIDVALRATTGQFDREMLKSAGLTRQEFNAMKKSVSATQPAIDKAREALEQFDKLAGHGAFTLQQYSEGAERLKREIGAQEEGFHSFADASKVVDQVLGKNRTTLERLAEEMQTVERAMRAGAATEEDLARIQRRHASEAERVAEAERQAGHDAKAAALGLGSMTEALEKSEAIMRRHESAEDRLARETRELNGLYKSGTLDVRSYRAEIDRLGREYRESTRRGNRSAGAIADQIPVVGRFNSVLAAGGPAALGAAAGVGVFVAGALAAGRAVRFVAGEITEAWEEIDQLGKTSAKLGMTVNELVGLRLAIAEGSGLEDNAIDQALQRFVRRTAEAAKGLGEAKGAISDLGLDAVELQAMGPQKALEAVADKMAGIEDSGERLRLSFKLFDSEGAALVTTLAGGSASIQEAAGFAQKWLGLTEQQADQTQRMNDALGRVDIVSRGIAQTWAAELAPMVTNFASDITSSADQMQAMDESAARTAENISGMVGAMKDYWKIVKGADNALAGLVGLGPGTDKGIAQLKEGLRLAGGWQEALETVRERVNATGASEKAMQNQQELANAREMEAAVDRIKSTFGDPSDMLGERMAEIQKMLGEEMIDPSSAERAAQAATKAFEGSLSGLNPFGSTADQVREQIAEVEQAMQSGALDKAIGEQLVGGFTDELWKPINDAAEKAAKEQEKLQADLDRRAEALRSAIQTPAQELADKMTEAQELFAAGAITVDERNRAQDAAIEAAQKEPAGNVSAAMKGSAEAFAAEMRGKDKTAEKQLGVAKNQLKELGTLNENVVEMHRAVELLQTVEGV